ncbi:hypothetical protein [Bacteroides sp.]
MKKKYKLILLCACAMVLSFSSCSDDDNNSGAGTELTPEQNKQKLESIGLNTIGKIKATDHADLLQTIDAFAEYINEGDLEIERNEVKTQVAGLLTEIRAICVKSNLGMVADFASANSDVYRVAQYYGIYTYNETNEEWDYVSSDSKLEFHFNADKKAAVITVTASGEETKVSMDDETAVMVPENVKVTISKDGKNLCELTVTLKVNTVNNTADIETRLSASGYVFLVKTNATETKANANFTLSKDNEVLISATTDLTGEKMTDKDAIEDAIDDDNMQGIFKSANVVVNIINEATIKASCSNIANLSELLEQLDRDNSWKEQYGKEYNDKVAAAYNKYMDIKLYYTSDAVIADFKMQTYYDADDYYYDYTSGTYPTPIVKGLYGTELAVVFAIDDSAYSLDSYFDEISFNDLIKSAENLGEQYKNYLKKLCD